MIGRHGPSQWATQAVPYSPSPSAERRRRRRRRARPLCASPLSPASPAARPALSIHPSVRPSIHDTDANQHRPARHWSHSRRRGRRGRGRQASHAAAAAAVKQRNATQRNSPTQARRSHIQDAGRSLSRGPSPTTTQRSSRVTTALPFILQPWLDTTSDLTRDTDATRRYDQRQEHHQDRSINSLIPRSEFLHPLSRTRLVQHLVTTIATTHPKHTPPQNNRISVRQTPADFHRTTTPPIAQVIPDTAKPEAHHEGPQEGNGQSSHNPAIAFNCPALTHRPLQHLSSPAHLLTCPLPTSHRTCQGQSPTTPTASPPRPRTLSPIHRRRVDRYRQALPTQDLSSPPEAQAHHRPLPVSLWLRAAQEPEAHRIAPHQEDPPTLPAHPRRIAGDSPLLTKRLRHRQLSSSLPKCRPILSPSTRRTILHPLHPQHLELALQLPADCMDPLTRHQACRRPVDPP